MKVGVVTIPGRFNYGNRLQNYAAVKIYEGLGFQVDSLILEDSKIRRLAQRALLRLRGGCLRRPREAHDRRQVKRLRRV